MYLAVRHTTTYRYEQPVLLEPHLIRLTPRADSYRHLLERKLTIIPEPDGSSVQLETNGSLVHLVWFKRQTLSLSIVSNFVIELSELNPFDYIVYPHSCLTLPMNYPSQTALELKPYMAGPIHDDVQSFALGIMKEANNNVLEFARLLCQKIRLNVTYEPRMHGEPYTPQKVLALRRGSCRDLALLFVAAARVVGLASRFVSGYYFDESPKHPQLHAWGEVYIPGGGWRGYDPTLGLACYGHHIALASGVLPSQAAAVEGAFTGHAGSQMDVEISYEYLKQVSCLN